MSLLYRFANQSINQKQETANKYLFLQLYVSVTYKRTKDLFMSVLYRQKKIAS